MYVTVNSHRHRIVQQLYELYRLAQGHAYRQRQSRIKSRSVYTTRSRERLFSTFTDKDERKEARPRARGMTPKPGSCTCRPPPAAADGRMTFPPSPPARPRSSARAGQHTTTRGGKGETTRVSGGPRPLGNRGPGEGSSPEAPSGLESCLRDAVPQRCGRFGRDGG